MSSPVVLITGALTGIGRAAAVAFANEGARIVIPAGEIKRARNCLQKCEVGCRSQNSFALTFATKKTCASLVDKTVERFGRLDMAVNNAGTEGSPGPVTEQTAESYAATFDTNVLGTLLSMKHELRVMLPREAGVSSMSRRPMEALAPPEHLCM